MLHVLFSLLLLVAQQMAFTHDLSHGSASAVSAIGHSDDSGDGGDGHCSQCAAFADVEPAPGADFPSLWLADAGVARPPAAPLSSPCARTVCVFRSRAPPLA